MNSNSTTNPPENLGTLDLQISDPVSMLNEIARRYESTERILMEYVDNALDDAETLYRDNKAYPYPIKIEVFIDAETQSVTVRDNCRGMQKDILERIVRNVGESQKRGLTWVNGRFGFGVQAFRAAADVIRFQTKHQNSDHLMLELQRNQHRGIKGAQPLTEPFPSNTGTGAMVTISAIENEWFENITVGSIKQEIESHFERLLARSNLVITVQEAGKEPVRCEPFRYRDIPGKDLQRVLKLKLKGEIYPVEVHLKIADFEVPGRSVRFFARGRRINHVAEIKSFIRKSAYRTSVWGHPHLLGYIEVGEVVRPVITRDDFVRNQGRSIFYEAILGLEDEVKYALDRVNEAQRDTTLNRLEDVLRNVLDTIARQDRRRLRLHMATQRLAKPAKSRQTSSAAATARNASASSEVPLKADRPASEFSPLSNSSVVLPHGPQTNDVQPRSASDNGNSRGPGVDEVRFGGNIQSQPATLPPNPKGEVQFSYEAEHSAPAPQPAPRRRSSFDIQFFDIPPDAEGQVKRSYLVDSTIYINVAHPDFQERMTYSRLGQPKVTDRLGAYIAATVSIHYKDQFYAKYGYMPDRRDLLFDEQVDFIFRLEAALREHLPALERELAKQKKQEGAVE